MGVGLRKQDRIGQDRSAKEKKEGKKVSTVVSGKSPETTRSRRSNRRRHAVAGCFRQTPALLHFGTSAAVDLDNRFLVRMSQATRLSKNNGSPKASGRAEGPLFRGI